jgi:GntR family transcriptional regulator
LKGEYPVTGFSAGGLEPLDPLSERAVFRQIADRVREAIDRDIYREGDQVPSEADLTGYFGVARMTVRRAIQQLQSEGLVMSESHRGDPMLAPEQPSGIKTHPL